MLKEIRQQSGVELADFLPNEYAWGMEGQEAAAKKVVERLQNAGFTTYFAGGFVRDYLMKVSSDDIDIATKASTIQVEKLFEKTIPVGVSFGIIIVVFEGHHFEVASFRKDRKYVDGRRPSGIDLATPQEDAKRRDFTINGMFFDPIQERLYDFVQGREDLKKGVIRAIGNPHERFLEDRLRMIRAVRYATRFDFPIEEKTLAAIYAHAAELFPAVAMERIWQELKKMDQRGHLGKGLRLLAKLNLLKVIFTDLKSLSYDQVCQKVAFIPDFPKKAPTFAKILELFPCSDLEEVYKLAQYLKLSNKEADFAQFYHHAQSLLSMPPAWLEKLEQFEWAQFLANPHSQISVEMVAIKLKNKEDFLVYIDKKRTLLAPHIKRLAQKNPYLRSEHLRDAGVLPGPHMGKLLDEGMRLAVNQDNTDPDQILKTLKNSPHWKLCSS